MAKGKVSHFIASALIFRGSDCLVGERTRIVNRMKATLARLGVRNSNPPCAGQRSVLQRCTPQRACRYRQMYWPSCSARSGARRREQGLAKAGNARVRRGMIQLAWRFLRFQKQSALAQWYRARTADSRLGTRKTMIVALARKLLIALWRFVTTGETLDGVILRPAG